MLIIKKDIQILGKGPTQGLERTLTAEKMYLINFTLTKKKFCLHYNGANSYLFVNGTEIQFKAKDSEVVATPLCFCLHYNGANSYLFVNGTEIQFKAKDSEVVATPFCLGSISKDWSVDNVRKNWI